MTPPHQPRRQRRFKIFEPALMQAADGAHRIHLLDLSRSGAQLHSPAACAPQAQVRIDCGGWSHSAEVAWAKGARVGVRFLTALSERELAGILGS